MRVLRVLIGIVTLLIALPVLGAGGVAWWAMQHRSPDGAFHAELNPIEAPAGVLVVPDLDGLLRQDAPYARAGQTELRLTVDMGEQPAFVGIADPGQVAVFLAGTSYTELREARTGRGPLVSRTNQVVGEQPRIVDPAGQNFWIRQGTGGLRWTPADDRGRPLALVIVAAPAEPSVMLAQPMSIAVALTPNWLNSTTWGLLILGPVLLLLGFALLAWPQRPREIVYVVDPAVAAQAGLPAPPQRHNSAVATVPVQSRATAYLAPAGFDPAVASPANSLAPAIPVSGANVAPTQAAPAVTATAGAIVNGAPEADGTSAGQAPGWPPVQLEPPATSPAVEASTEELPLIGADLPMPIIGMRFAKDAKAAKDARAANAANARVAP